MKNSKQKLKIGIDVRPLLEAQYGGISWYLHHTLQNLFNLDNFNQYYLFYNRTKNHSRSISGFKQTNVIKKGYKIPSWIFNSSLNLLQKPKLDLLTNHQGLDLFWLPNMHVAPVSKKCKLVLTVHDLSFIHYSHCFTFKDKIWHTLVNFKKLCQRVDKIIAVSEFTANDLINYCKIPAEKVAVIPLGINTKFFYPRSTVEKNAIRDKYKLPQKFILSLATFEPRKNIIGLIEAYLKLNKPYPLVLVGNAGWQNHDLMQKISKIALDKEIIVLIDLKEADKPALLSAASFFVYASFFEGFGLPPLEAMACGTAVISSQASSLPEVVGEAGLLVDPYNLGEISFAMNELMTDSKLRESLVKQGLAQSKKFSWQKNVKQVLKVLITV